MNPTVLHAQHSYSDVPSLISSFLSSTGRFIYFPTHIAYTVTDYPSGTLITIKYNSDKTCTFSIP